MVRVLTAGHVNWDVTLRVDRLPEPDGEATIRSQSSGGGGSAANTAVALTSLGERTGILGSVGDDEHGHLVRRELADRGVDLSGLATVDGGQTSVKYLLTDEDGSVAVLGNDGVNEALGPEDVDSTLVRDAEHLHLTGQRPDTARRLAKIASEASVSVSFDPGRRLPDRDFSGALALADLVFCNDREAKAMADRTDVLDDDCTLVVTRGGAGASALTADRTWTHEGFGVDPVDTSGTGDAFAAGFLASWLDGSDVDRCLSVGNACGALAAERSGARTTPTRSQIVSLLDGSRDAQ